MRLKVRNAFYGPRWPFQSEFHYYEGEVVATPKWVDYPAISLTTGEKKFPVRIVSKDMIVEIDGEESIQLEKNPAERTFSVAGSKGNSYTVTVGPKIKTCTCPAFQFRRSCKHIVQIAA